MKLVESKAEYIPQENGLEGIYKQIELAGRTAYHSQDKITPNSAKNFVDRMVKSKHGAALEHGTVYFVVPYYSSKYHKLPYTKIREVNGNQYVTTNYRVLEEAFDLKNFWEKNIRYICSPTRYHEKRYTMRFTCSRAIAQELTRHRVFSFLMESQRYINYSKERHGGEITFIIPSWFGKAKECSYNTMIEDIDFLDSLGFEGEIRDRAAWITSAFLDAEKCYFKVLEAGATPQQARDVLPNATKTEIVVTGFASDWRHLLDLRLFEKTGRVHPDMLSLMQKAQKAMQEAGVWEDIMSKPSEFE